MFLSDKDIERAVKAREIRLEPFEKKLLQPASYDIRLGTLFIVDEPESIGMVDPAKNVLPKTHSLEVTPGDAFILHPGASVLAHSFELFGSDKYLIHVNSKSSLARIGLLVHNATGIVNPGHILSVALELTNTNRAPIALRPGMEIAQLTFTPLSSEAVKPYRTSAHHLHSVGGYRPPKSGPLARRKKAARSLKRRRK